MSPGGLPLLTDGTAWLPAASPGDLVVLELTGFNPVWVAQLKQCPPLDCPTVTKAQIELLRPYPSGWTGSGLRPILSLAPVALAFFEAFSGASVTQVPQCLHGMPPKARLPGYLLWYP